MKRDESNRKLAEWLGVPCWHEWIHQIGSKGFNKPTRYCCSRCDEYSMVGGNPDYYTNSGFFALLDGLKKKGYGGINICPMPELFDEEDVATVKIYINPELDFVSSDRSDLPTALVEAALQVIDKLRADPAESGSETLNTEEKHDDG